MGVLESIAFAGGFDDLAAMGEPIGGGSERRIDYGPGYRIYFGRDGQKLIVLVGGGTKSRQSRDIKNAQEIWAEYKRTKNKE